MQLEVLLIGGQNFVEIKGCKMQIEYNHHHKSNVAEIPTTRFD